MASSFSYLLRRLTSSARTIMTSSARAEKALENLKENPFFDKYAQKLTQVQKTAPEEFVQRLEEQEKAKRKPKFGTVDTRQYSSVLNPKEALKDKVDVQDKQLDAIFKVDLVQDKNAEEIRTIWEEYHKHKDVIAATIAKEVFEGVRGMMRKHPTFILPLPRAQGYEFIMCQALGNTVHFTPLLAFQVHKENAPECLTMIHYTELSEDKGIVLMRGEYDKNTVNAKEALCLANQFQLYYNNSDDRKQRLLEAFTSTPESFKHMDVIAELENLTLA